MFMSVTLILVFLSKWPNNFILSDDGRLLPSLYYTHSELEVFPYSECADEQIVLLNICRNVPYSSSYINTINTNVPINT